MNKNRTYIERPPRIQPELPQEIIDIPNPPDQRDGGIGELMHIALHYPAGSGEAGKSGDGSDGSDGSHARFVELEPYTRIIQAIEFESDDADYSGEMRMTVDLVEARPGTRLTIDFDNIPPGIALEDNRRGTEMSLEKLAVLVDRRAC